LGGPIQQPEYLGSFLILAVVSLLATGVLLGLHMPADEPAHSERAAGRPWRQIVAQPTYRVALFGAATGYGIMILAMTATPLAMLHHDHGLGSAATVIQLHVLGMFLPSFITGTLIVRFGVLRIMLVGVLLFIGHILLTLTGTSFSSFASALILLGVGWNFMYIGGTTLLTSTYTPAEKGSAQAINDMLIFAVGLICSFGAGGLLHALGWQTLNLVLLPWLGLAAASLIWLGIKQARQQAEQGAAGID
jgi:MFS family permease